MREVLFRGRIINCSIKPRNGQQAYGLYHKLNDKHIITQVDYHKLSYEVDTETIGQYIGAKDKKGKKIFDGDIIETPIGNQFVVGWQEELLRWAMKSEDLWYELRPSFLKVVGNIHENSEKTKTL